MFTKEKEFIIANEKRKIELIRIDAFNLMKSYLKGEVEYFGFQQEISKLSELGLISKMQIIEKLKNIVNYEAYQCSIGQSKNEYKRIGKRVKKFKEDC